ncbi:BrnT family toxin [Lentisalinibacter sediminis]|uniref:BrnT family toxin n=1 Tax=Lentisalinibacter sediminis TaxID=2992237 RepID=UPI0038666C6F
MTYNQSLRFEWDDAKNLANRKKHGLSLSEASQLFHSGGDYLEIFDADHSDEEDRFIGIGPVDRGIVVVVYMEPEDDLVRIIGARFATRREQNLYRKYMDSYR